LEPNMHQLQVSLTYCTGADRVRWILRGRGGRQDSGGKFLLGEETKRFIIGRDQYEECPQHKGERAHDTAMAQDCGVRAGSAVPGGCDVFDGWATE
jgi:hypothetical protein